MTRFAPWLAVAVSLLALAIACVSLKRRAADPVPAEGIPSPAAPAGAAPANPDPAARTSTSPGLSASEATDLATAAAAKREREIVDRIWPRIARFREMQHLSAAPKPTKLDDALMLFLEFAEGEDGSEEGSPQEQKDTMRCKNQLKQIGVYFALYESKFKLYPASLDDIKRPDLLTDPKILICPFDKSGDACSFEYIHPLRGDHEAPDMIMAYDKHVHSNGKRCVLYFQGRVEDVLDAEFQKKLSEQVASDRADLVKEVQKARDRASDNSLSAAEKEIAMKRLTILESLSR